MSIFSSLSDVLGLNGKQGDYYKGTPVNTRGADSLAAILQGARSGEANAAGQSLLNGSSLEDATKGLSPDQLAGLAASPIYGEKVGEQEMLSDPALSGLFNKGGSRDQALAEEAKLENQGFKLQPEDYEAYGQASGNIARQFGQQEQSLASALADRGLASAPNGATNVAFTGMMGNKNEQLGQLQMQIAQQRMQMTRQRLADTRSYIDSISGLGENAKNADVNANLNAYNSRVGNANDLSNADNANARTQAGIDQASKASELAQQKQNLGDAIGSGLYQGVEAGSGGAMAGMFSSKTNQKNTVAPSQAGGANPSLMSMYA